MDDSFFEGACTFLSIPVLGQLIGGAGGAIATASGLVDELDDTKYFDNLPCKIFAGVAGGVSGMSPPLSPYLWVPTSGTKGSQVTLTPKTTKAL